MLGRLFVAAVLGCVVGVVLGGMAFSAFAGTPRYSGDVYAWFGWGGYGLAAATPLAWWLIVERRQVIETDD